MDLRRVFSTILMVLAAWVAPGAAQERLGDLVDSGGYDWIIGRWVAGTDEGREAEFVFDWALDKSTVLNRIRIGDFRYQGMIWLSPTDREAVEEGADSQGGVWKGTWSPEGEGLVRRVEHTNPEGRNRKGDILFGRLDADTITIAIHAVDDSGNRSAEPWTKLTYKRQQGKPAPVSTAAETTGRSSDYQKLGDLVSEGGYEWMIGKWVATEGDRTYELEYRPLLDMHAAQAEVKIGSFHYLGMILYVPSRQEVVQVGADNMGGVWRGTWEQDGSDAVYNIEYIQGDGTMRKLQHVSVKIDSDTLEVRQYDLGTDGKQRSDRGSLTFKRQKPATPTKS